MTKFPANYEDIQLRYCSNSRKTPESKNPGRMGKRILKNMEEALPYFKKFGKNFPILDVGCGDGYALECFKIAGYKEVHGIEYVSARVNTAMQHGIINVVKGAAEETENIVKARDWPVPMNVFCSHVLEHTIDQAQAIRSIQKVANILWIIVPVEAKVRSNRNVHPSPVRDLGQLQQYFPNEEWTLLKKQVRKNYEIEGLLGYVRK